MDSALLRQERKLLINFNSRRLFSASYDRSQHRNKAEAMQMLKARLFEMELQKKNAETNRQNASILSINLSNIFIGKNRWSRKLV